MKIKLLTPILGLTASVGTITPFVCSCSDLMTIAMSNNVVPEPNGDKVFAAKGNFNAGTNYEFSANLEGWINDYGKPTDWNKVTTINFWICDSANGKIEKDFVDTSKIKISVDGTTLKKVDNNQNTGEWKHEWDDNTKRHVFSIAVKDGNPIKANSKLLLTNVKFKSDRENIAICLNAK